jgi:hypothetical protein
MKIRAIITGVTGMVGEGVLHECLNHPAVEHILVVNRKPCGVSHPKLKEIIHTNFFDITPIENELKGYNACFFCLGVSSVGMKEEKYTELTYTLTMHVARVMVKQSPEMTFCYVSGKSTDSTEKGRQMWARVKGKTENDLMKLPFKKVYCFRPGFMKPTPGMKNTNKFYKYINWAYPLFRALGGATTLKELGISMINSVLKEYEKSVIEVKDIIELAKR